MQKNAGLFSLSDGKTELFLMATEIEYGKFLRDIFTPYIIGVGPVEAAINTTKILCQLNTLPNFVIILGSSGSATLEQGKVYQAGSVSYRDMDASPLGFEKGATPFLKSSAEISLETPISDIPTARLSTGGNIITTNAFADVDAHMIDMETYAVKRVCQVFDLPLIAFRGISDGASQLRKYEDWTKLLPLLDKNLALAVQKFIQQH